MTTLERLTTLISEPLCIQPETVTPESRFTEDLGADSLDQVEMVMEAEDEFRIMIPDNDAEAIKTVADAVELVDRLIKEQSA